MAVMPRIQGIKDGAVRLSFAVRREADRRLFVAFCGPMFENGHQLDTRGKQWVQINLLTYRRDK